MITLPDELAAHPQAIAVGVEGLGAWVMLQAHCARYAPEGVVPRAMLSAILGRRDPRRLLERLASARVRVDGPGLAEILPGGDVRVLPLAGVNFRPAPARTSDAAPPADQSGDTRTLREKRQAAALASHAKRRAREQPAGDAGAAVVQPAGDAGAAVVQSASDASAAVVQPASAASAASRASQIPDPIPNSPLPPAAPAPAPAGVHKPQSLSAALHRIGEVGGAGLSPAVLAKQLEERAPGLAIDRIVAWMPAALEELGRARRGPKPIQYAEAYVASYIGRNGSKDPPGGQIVPSDLAADTARAERRAAAEREEIERANERKSAERAATLAKVQAGQVPTLASAAPTRPAFARAASAGGHS